MCPDEETILGYFRGQLSTDARAQVEAHLADCEECRVLVSVLARSSVPEGMLATAATPVQGSAHELGSAETEAASSGSARSAKSFPPAPVSPGDIVAGKYRVERVLGAGGMGIVVRAHHVELDRPVALKFLLPQACEAPGAVERFLREGRAAARLESEHVARVLDTGTLAGAPFLVMEYLEGSDLAELLAARGRLPVRDAITYVLQACEAIAEAHAAGIVHRDLKPSNLFLTTRPDGSPRVKVLDFGISKLESGSRPDLTASSMMMGSPRYMSPEQMTSARDADARTDVWALGVVLFELVSGRPVWEAETVQGLCALIAAEPAPRLTEVVPDAPAALEETIARCLAKEPRARLGSVRELAAALEAIAAGKPPPPSVHGRPYVSSALPPQAPRGSTGALRVVGGLSLLVLLTGLVGGALMLARPDPEGPAAAASKRRREALSAAGTGDAGDGSEAAQISAVDAALAAAPGAAALTASPRPAKAASGRPPRPAKTAAPPPEVHTAKATATVAPARPAGSSRALSDRK